MKKIIISALMLITITGTAFSRDKNAIDKNVLTAFNKSFNKAKEVKWEPQKDFVKVTFLLDDQTFFAYYNLKGEQIALIRNIDVSQLPISLGAPLKQKFINSWLTELFEVSSEGSTRYYATVQSATHVTVLKAEASGSWATFKKDKKDGQ